jgi:uncharacterized protein (TIGR02246 family)
MRLHILMPALVFAVASAGAIAQTPQSPAGQPDAQQQTQKAGQQGQKGGAAETQKLRDEYIAAWTKGDARAIAMLYVEQALFVNAAGQVMSGRQEIQQAHEKQFAGPWKGTKLTVTPGRTQMVGDMMVEEGRYQLTGGEAAKMGGDRGHYLITLARTDGQWRIASHAALVPQEMEGGKKPM